MKKLFVGIVFILGIGVAGFLYRNHLERPLSSSGICTADAKICPDGTGVGRTGPSCAFAKCAPPNVEFPDAGVSFALPGGFGTGSAPASETLIANYEQTDTAAEPDTIAISLYEIPKNSTANAVIMEKTIFSPKGENAQSMDDFAKVTIGTHTFYRAILERYEGYVQVAYYVSREKDVLAFVAIDKNVADWTEPTLAIDTLPAQSALLLLLGTLQIMP